MPAGAALWSEVIARLGPEQTVQRFGPMDEERGRFGNPQSVLPRLGQGGFRVLVTDAYARRCAITGERTLPALEAAHIRPFSEEGPHRIDNGVLLRSDWHHLFDAGYVTLTDDCPVLASRRIRAEFENGHDYYAFDGHPLIVPPSESDRPSREFLAWHREKWFERTAG